MKNKFSPQINCLKLQKLLTNIFYKNFHGGQTLNYKKLLTNIFY